LEAIEDRIDADLRLGLSRELVSELQSLARQHPLRERFVTSLMLALYRSGRAAEALRVCSAFRSRLVSEIGVEPSRTVRDLEHSILIDDGDLLLDGHVTGESRGPRSGLTVRGYELREELGRGAFGSVFRAYQPSVGREVAIKVIKPELADDPAFIRRFEAEAQLVAALEHPHIIPLYDYWREPGAAYLVMRLVQAGTLADALALGALPTDRAATTFAQIADALRSAHRHGVVHGDVKPENVLIDGAGNAYLTDFGVALMPDAEGQLVDGPGSSLTMPYASPEQRAHRPLSTASDVYSLAVVAAAALAGLNGEYEQIRGALSPAVRTVLDRATAPDPGRRYADAAALARALIDALGTPATPVLHSAAIENPYKGLRPFGAADAGDFFGRERLVERLIARLGEPGSRGRFVAVVGPSGSGKSSVVRAGLLPALAQGALAMSAEWFRVEMTPAPHPFEQLEAALVHVATEAPTSLIDVLLAPGGVRRAVRRILPDEDHGQLLLVIDQFEELFTQVDDDTATRFIDELVDLVTTAGTRVRVVITLRADFYDRPLGHRGLGELLRDGTEVITPMSTDELEAAIIGPAARVGVEIEPLVVSEMVAEIVDRPGALPLLQYTLTVLFEARAGRPITVAAYRQGGGVSRTLARRADALLGGLGAEATETARRAFLRLVSLDEDGSGSGTRRRALVAEVEELDDRGRVQRVLGTFGRHRLLSFDRDAVTRGPTVEISHEALLTEWATLRDWVDDARDDLRTHHHLVAEMKAWTAADHSPDYLLRGERLDNIASWASSTTMGLRPTEHHFLDASLAARREEQRVRQEEERQRNEAERRVRRRTRQLVIAGLATALVAVLAGFAWAQRQDARRSEADLTANQAGQRLATLSVNSLSTDPELSLLLAEAAVSTTADRGYALPEAIDAVHWALQDLGVQYDVTTDTPTAARSGPGGVRGVWVLPVGELMSLADSAVGRELTDEECRRYVGSSGCPTPMAMAGIEYLGGTDAYASAAPLEQAEVVIGIQDSPDGGAELQTNLDTIREKYGLRVRLQRVPFRMAAEAEGIDADIHILGGTDIPEAAEARPLVDVRDFIDETQLLTDYGPYLVSLARVGRDGTWPSESGPVHGVFVGGSSKAMIWTKEPEFTDRGYRAPSDWTSFIALADEVVADGRTPFCVGLESGGFADGWPATDWVEMVVLRTAGPAFYDAWTRHVVPFDDPAVVEAIRTVGEMVHGPGFLDVEPEAAALRNWEDALLDLTERPDACLMTPFPSFMPAEIGADDELSVGSFPFPTFGTGFDDAVVGGGSFAVAVTDRPEVRRLMAALASPDWGLGSAELEWPGLLPANVRFDTTTIVNPDMAEVVTGMHEAIRSGNLRFDASDNMPQEIGFGAFHNGMVRLFREGSRENLDELSFDIAHDIEASWLELEATAD
jgi:ABC-type glycerol-3-phosphate transport system substrate-binding protein